MADEEGWDKFAVAHGWTGLSEVDLRHLYTLLTSRHRELPLGLVARLRGLATELQAKPGSGPAAAAFVLWQALWYRNRSEVDLARKVPALGSVCARASLSPSHHPGY